MFLGPRSTNMMSVMRSLTMKNSGLILVGSMWRLFRNHGTVYPMGSLLSSTIHLFAFLVVWFGGTIDVPHLLSMRLSNHLHFLASIGLLISATWRGQWERWGTMFPFALRIHWAISFPFPHAGPNTRPKTS